MAFTHNFFFFRLILEKTRQLRCLEWITEALFSMMVATRVFTFSPHLFCLRLSLLLPFCVASTDCDAMQIVLYLLQLPKSQWSFVEEVGWVGVLALTSRIPRVFN